jgi:hypothetical protein
LANGNQEEGHWIVVAPSYVGSLIRLLAETESQGSIAKILNEKGITRPDGQVWKQFSVCRHMQENNIPAVHKWRGTRNMAHDK